MGYLPIHYRVHMIRLCIREGSGYELVHSARILAVCVH